MSNKAKARLLFERDGARLEDISRETGLGLVELAALATEELWVLPAVGSSPARRDRIHTLAEDEVERSVARAVAEQLDAMSADLREDAIIEANALEVSRVMKLHRAGATQTREIVVRLTKELQLTCLKEEQVADILEAIALEESQEGDTEAQQRRTSQRVTQAFKRLLSLDTRVDTAKKLVESLARVVDLERRVYGIKDEGNESDVARALKELAEHG